jgi:hypothetical protein
MKKITYIDLGLPSGTLWASSNSEIRGKRHFTYDEAMKNFGDHMPTIGQFRELFHDCRWQWIELFGGKVKGYRITGPNGNRIFLPDSGGYTEYEGRIFGGNYLSATHDPTTCYIHILRFDDYSICKTFGYDFYRRSVRTVINSNENIR